MRKMPKQVARMFVGGILVTLVALLAPAARAQVTAATYNVKNSGATATKGDDAIVFYSYGLSGPPLPCENITITNCRLSSASCALKFCDCNINCIRNVTVDNWVITGSNRGIGFMLTLGGYVENVVLSNLVVNCKRYRCTREPRPHGDAPWTPQTLAPKSVDPRNSASSLRTPAPNGSRSFP